MRSRSLCKFDTFICAIPRILLRNPFITSCDSGEICNRAPEGGDLILTAVHRRVLRQACDWRDASGQQQLGDTSVILIPRRTGRKRSRPRARRFPRAPEHHQGLVRPCVHGSLRRLSRWAFSSPYLVTMSYKSRLAHLHPEMGCATGASSR